MKKYILLTFTALSIQLESAQCGYEYADVFDRELYDQSTILHKVQNKNDEEINKILIDSFHKKKKELLNNGIIKIIKERISYLQKNYDKEKSNEAKKTLLTTVLDELSTFIKAGGSIVGNIIGNSVSGSSGQLAGSIIGGIAGEFVCLPAKIIGKTAIEKHYPPNYAATIYGKMQELDLEIFKLIQGLDSGSEKDLEKLEVKYIKKKRKILDAEMQKNIEEKFLEYRKSSFQSEKIKAFLKVALKLAVDVKPLLNPNAVMASKDEMAERFNKSSFFQNYDSNTKKTLENIIFATASDSISSSSQQTKKAYYFWGKPSTGKTSAARKIPDFLGLPWFETTAISPQEFTKANIEGQILTGFNPSPGWFINSFIEKNPADKKSYKNAFLIINDIDQVIKSAETLSFLLHYLDSNVTKLKHEYFNTEIDIGHWNIIITSNKNLEDNNACEALKSRINFSLEFPEFSQNVKTKIINSELKMLTAKHHIPKIFSFEFLNPSLGFAPPSSLVGYYKPQESDIYATENKMPNSTEITFDKIAPEYWDIYNSISLPYIKMYQTEYLPNSLNPHPPVLSKPFYQSEFTAPSLAPSKVFVPPVINSASQKFYQQNVNKYPFFFLPIEGTGEKKVSFRELRAGLDFTLSNFSKKIATKGGNWYKTAELLSSKDEKQALSHYKKAALIGYEKAYYPFSKVIESTYPSLAYAYYSKAKDANLYDSPAQELGTTSIHEADSKLPNDLKVALPTYIPKPKDELTFISLEDDVIALNTKSGKEKWSKNFSDYYGVARLYYGKDANLLFVCKNGYAWALNPKNGKQVWYNPMVHYGKSEYSTMAATAEKLFLGFNGYLASLDAKKGNILEYFSFKGHSDVTLELHNGHLYAGVDGSRYRFNPNQIGDYKQKDPRFPISDGIRSLSINEKYVCFTRDGILVVDDANTLVSIAKHQLDSKKALVVCDNEKEKLDNIYVATENKVQLFTGKLTDKTSLPVKWTYKHGADTLSLAKNSQDKSILICSRNKKVLALDPENGQKIWKYNITDHFILNDSKISSILPQEKSSLIICFNGNIVALSTSDGKEQWETIMWRNQNSLKSGIATMKGEPSNCNDLIRK